MKTTLLHLDDEVDVEVTFDRKAESMTVGTLLIINGQRAPEKTCSVTCHYNGKSKTHTWTCPNDKMCEGDCSNPQNPKGSCY